MSITEKLIIVQSALKVPKTHTNDFSKYKYRSCEDILEALKPLLKEHDLLLLMSDEIVPIGTRIYVKATAAVTDGSLQKDSNECVRISVSAFAREPETKKGTDESQITGAASSYARKYALNGLFCIDDTKDADTEEGPSKVIEVKDKCSTGEALKIIDLAKETGTDIVKLYALFEVSGVPTKKQAAGMIASLNKKLAAQIDAATKS